MNKIYFVFKLSPFFASVFSFFKFYLNDHQENINYILLKCLPIVFLCLLVWFNGKYAYGKCILFGLIFSVLGDAFIVYRGSFYLFLFGVICFALAHLCYISAFGFKPIRLWLGLCIYSFAVPFIIFYFSNINDPIMKLVALIYSFIIHSMLWRSLARLSTNNKTGKLFSIIGACLFLISDNLLAYDLFVGKLSYSNISIMGTYYAAQFFLSISALTLNTHFKYK